MVQERRGGAKKHGGVYGGVSNATKQHRVKVASGFVANATMFSRLGGEEIVAAAVSQFNEKIAGDDRVKQFTTNKTTQPEQFERQVEFVSILLGKPNPKKIEMRVGAKLAELGISDAHTSAMLESVKAVLAAQDIAADLADEITTLVERVSKNITR